MPFIVGFAGHSGVGKNTCADLLKAVCPLRVGTIAFASEIKKTSYSFYAHLGLQDESFYEANRELRHVKIPSIEKTPVQIWSEIGGTMRGVYRNTWVDKAIMSIADSIDDITCITDVRYPSEIEAIYAKGGVVVKVHNPRAKPLSLETDHALDGWGGKYSFEVLNDGSETQLENRIYNLWRSISKLLDKTRTPDKVLAS